MEQEINKLTEEALKSISSAVSLKEIEEIKIKFLGRKGKLTVILRNLAGLPLEKRRTIGALANKAKQEILSLIENRLSEFKQDSAAIKDDLTKPGEKIAKGHLHPLVKVEREIRKIFTSLNFSVVEGPEVESEYYNFDALNIPANHPARDMWDTFWLKDGYKLPGSKTKKERLLLRTHTSPMQIRYMETHNPPFQIIVPGRVFRYEATDASHEINFYQVEGLMVGQDVSLANLKFIIETFLKKFFGPRIKFRFRPSYFPFVEPGLEVDIKFGSKSGASWLEVMGAGMVHRRVFEAARYNPDNVSGFAFGMGLDRLAMIKYNIPDIRLFYSGDLRFVRQFN